MEYYIKRVIINGLFEKDNNYKIDLSEGCNCIFGDNGAGKTTIINLIVNCLNVELESLAKIAFESITIFLAKAGQVRAAKFLVLHRVASESHRSGYEITYQIEESEPHTFVIRSREYSDRIQEKYGEIPELLKQSILSKINLTHVPLLRMHDSEIFGMRDERDEYLHSALRHKNITQSQILEIMDPSVRVLNSLQKQFISEANETRKTITNKLEVLKSKIIEKVMIDESLVKLSSKALNKATKAIDSDLEDVNVPGYVKKLRDAKINVPEEKIYEHFKTWKKLNDDVKAAYKEMDLERSRADSKKINAATVKFNTSYFNLIAMTNFNDRFLSIVEDVESMQGEKLELTKSFSDYENEINSYFNSRKSFSLNEDGQFRVRSNNKEIRLSDLSSGEKHILTILGRAALSRKDGAIFVADEPELSLHLDWQRKILPSIIKLSPKSQVIVATHSPSIHAAGATEIDLEECR
ncbi:putative ATP-binding protein involved in virulence [Pseudomonas sp. BIGb0450]|uniref:ATP-binding protein n=1 Tax=unclassified Pseudomonas TaxID=196821 RepID=UPI002169FB35|nr:MULTISPECIES: ATP-binding protein [unclassified Pseudomonas]MCS3417025.1 putative ATP-binding protein involved in virulence [Pseudomonas sp. BIGb0558]MCS3436630.1 putative ATP-binding protein involved in virulence [Pseudomonas sp. BIGb0450]